MEDETSTLKELADDWKTCEKSLRRAIKSGLLEAFRIGNEYRVSPQQKEDYMKRTSTKGVPLKPE